MSRRTCCTYPFVPRHQASVLIGHQQCRFPMFVTGRDERDIYGTSVRFHHIQVIANPSEDRGKVTEDVATDARFGFFRALLACLVQGKFTGTISIAGGLHHGTHRILSDVRSKNAPLSSVLMLFPSRVLDVGRTRREYKTRERWPGKAIQRRFSLDFTWCTYGRYVMAQGTCHRRA